MRRYFFNAQESSPEAAQEALSYILAVYQVECEAERTETVGTDAHRGLRHRKARPLFDGFHAWLLDQQGRHTPKGPMGRAITHALTAWPTLLVYLAPHLRPGNNVAERALRAVALGRKNFMFVGNDDAGENLAVLQTLVATCHAHDVNPQTYLADVLIRIQNVPVEPDTRSLARAMEGTVRRINSSPCIYLILAVLPTRAGSGAYTAMAELQGALAAAAQTDVKLRSSRVGGSLPLDGLLVHIMQG